jgi:hypothetical protein
MINDLTVSFGCRKIKVTSVQRIGLALSLFWILDFGFWIFLNNLEFGILNLELTEI